MNNAGTGLQHADVSGPEIMNTNLYGTKMMTEAFLSMINPDSGRVVHVGSGAAPMWVDK